LTIADQNTALLTLLKNNPDATVQDFTEALKKIDRVESVENLFVKLQLIKTYDIWK